MDKKNIFILDCGTEQVFLKSIGWLNHHNTDLAVKTLTELGHDVVVTQVDSDWKVEEEVEKIKKADVLIIQTPAWWMAPPWTLKKYEDIVFPHVSGDDGRHRATPEDGYGTGGLLTNMHYMLSFTWNAPLGAFRPGDFFDGRSMDGVELPLHKALQFMGMKPLPTYMYNDVIKNPDLEKNDKCWVAHLKKYFS